jgi:hypothetical protein
MIAALSRTCDLEDFDGCLTVADWQQELADCAWARWLDAHHIRTREESLVVNYSGIPFVAPGPSAHYQYPAPWPGTPTPNGLPGTGLAAVWGLNVLNHVEAPVKFLQRACQALRPHGLLFLTFLAWNAEGEDCAAGHDRRRRIYDMQSRQKLITECRKLGLVAFGGIDWAYHGHWLGDHTVASLVLTRRGDAA